MKKSSLWISAAAALAVATVLAGCGQTTYVDGRTLPPSKLVNRVMIAVQNPSALTKGELAIVDAYYDERSAYNGTPGAFSVSSYGGADPITIQNMPEEQIGAVYGAGDGSLANVNYQKEASTSISGLNGQSSSIFMTRNQGWVFAANQAAHLFTVVSVGSGGSIALSLPGVNGVSTNPGGTVALAFVQNSNYAYYGRQLNTSQSLAYSGGPTTWPKAAVDCEPQAAPNWCLFQMQSPDSIDSTGNYTGAPLVFDRPVKAVYSNDGSTAYIVNCGPECGGTAASISIVPIAPLIFTLNQASGLLPCNTGSTSCANGAKPMARILVPGGSSNALVDGTTMYVVGQKPNVISGQTYYGGNLSVVNLSTNAVTNATAISDGQPGFLSRMIEADDNTLWIGMTGCTNGLRAATGLPQGCLSMYNTSTNSVTMIEPYLGDATGIAAVTGLHKIYTAEGGQVYIYSTVNGTALDNQYVTVTGTAWDVAYMDALTDANNTYY